MKAEDMPWRPVLALWAVASLGMIALLWGKLDVAAFVDADDALRLQQVRDWIAGQSWFDVTQYRAAPPAGVPMHWTRLVDVPIAALIVVLKPLLGVAGAELAACIAVPLLTLLAAMVIVTRLAVRFFGRDAAIAASVLVVLAAPASMRMMPLRIDHHGWQFVLALVALHGMADAHARRGGALAGAALAASLAISIEALPLAVVFALVCALRLWRGDGRWIAAYMASLGLTATILFAATRGLTDLADHCDAISPVHLLVLLWAAAGCALVLPRLRHRPVTLSLMTLGAFGAGAVAIMLLRAPQCLGSDAFAALDPLVRVVWLDSMKEGLPIWRQNFGVAGAVGIVPLLGLVACWRLWRQEADQARRNWWADLALLLGGAMLIGLLVIRASAVACLFAAIPAGWQLQEQVARWARESAMQRRMMRVPLIVALLVPWALTAALEPLVAAASASAPAPSAPSRPAQARLACDFGPLGPQLSGMPAETILAGVDLGPSILVTSGHKVVATGHHRANAAMRDLILAFLGPDWAARPIMARYGATLVMICPSGREAERYSELAPDGFMAHLVSGRAPEWLEPVPVAPESGIKLWRVK